MIWLLFSAINKLFSFHMSKHLPLMESFFPAWAIWGLNSLLASSSSGCFLSFVDMLSIHKRESCFIRETVVQKKPAVPKKKKANQKTPNNQQNSPPQKPNSIQNRKKKNRKKPRSKLILTLNCCVAPWTCHHLSSITKLWPENLKFGSYFWNS